MVVRFRGAGGLRTGRIWPAGGLSVRARTAAAWRRCPLGRPIAPPGGAML